MADYLRYMLIAACIDFDSHKSVDAKIKQLWNEFYSNVGTKDCGLVDYRIIASRCPWQNSSIVREYMYAVCC